VAHPKVFLQALGIGGGIFAMVIFGILPPLMCLRGRKNEGVGGYRLFGGTPLLIFLMFCAVSVICVELWKEFVGVL